jgi:hypothetical protein
MKWIIGISLLIALNSFGQDHLLENEKLVYSFKTYSGKTLMIAKDSNDRYLVYRYGTDSLIELEYPKNKNNSWKKFKYSYWLRGGGPENAGIDINFLYFDIDHYRYVVYWTYYSESEETNCGIKVINQNTKKETDIKGDLSTVRGSLVADFRWNELIAKGEELY